MGARTDLLATAGVFAAQARAQSDVGGPAFEWVTAAKTALEAAQLAPAGEEASPTDVNDALVEGFVLMRDTLRGMGDQFAHAGTPVATRHAERIKTVLDQVNDLIQLVPPSV